MVSAKAPSAPDPPDRADGSWTALQPGATRFPVPEGDRGQRVPDRRSLDGLALVASLISIQSVDEDR